MNWLSLLPSKVFFLSFSNNINDLRPNCKEVPLKQVDTIFSYLQLAFRGLRCLVEFSHIKPEVGFLEFYQLELQTLALVLGIFKRLQDVFILALVLIRSFFLLTEDISVICIIVLHRCHFPLHLPEFIFLITNEHL